MVDYFCIKCGKPFIKSFPNCGCNRKAFISVNIQADTVKDALVALWKAYKEIHQSKESLDINYTVANRYSILAVEAYDETKKD